MIGELEVVWKQFAETYAAIRESLAMVPEDRLFWEPAPGLASPSLLVRHIVRANRIYCHEIEQTARDLADLPDRPDRDQLHALLDGSERRVKEVFEAITEATAHEPRADDWQPLGPLVDGPLDSVWFALQIVRHSAYHQGQLNYLMQLGGFGINYE